MEWSDVHDIDPFKPKITRAQKINAATPNVNQKPGEEMKKTNLGSLVVNTILATCMTMTKKFTIVGGLSFGPIGGLITGGVLAAFAHSDNTLVVRYNDKLKILKGLVNEAKKLEKKIQIDSNKLKNEEVKLNNPVFRLERLYRNGKVILVIGPSGWGKSLLCNRLIGNIKDAFDIEDNALYEVGNGMNSVTSELRKVTKQVNVRTSTKILKHSFNLSVIDSPGQFDTEYKDEIGFKYLKEYFNASGGVTIFCIVFKFGERINSNYQDLLKLYAKFWGKGFWGKCIFAITYCDRDSKKNIAKLDKSLDENIQFFREKVLKISNGLSKNVPIFEFGEENFETSVKEIMLLINQDKYKNKYTCAHIKSPINELYKNVRQKVVVLRKIVRKIKTLEHELQTIKGSMISVKL